jgi:hypothetical protein
MSRTSPTITPRILTSARVGSCSPILLVCSVTGTTSTNFFVNVA